MIEKGTYNATPPTLTDGQKTDLQVDSAGSLKVAGAMTGSGNFSVVSTISEDGTIAASSTAGLIGAAQALNAQKTAMSTNGDKVNNIATMDGKQVIMPYSIGDLTWQYAGIASGIVSSTADTEIKAALATYRNYLTSISISHDTLSAVTEYVIKDGATVIYRGKLQVTATEGLVITFPNPLRGTANTALNFALLTSVTGGVYINAQGYTGV